MAKRLFEHNDAWESIASRCANEITIVLKEVLGKLEAELEEGDEDKEGVKLRKLVINAKPWIFWPRRPSIVEKVSGIPFEKYFFVKKDQKITNEDYEAAIKNINYFKLIGNIDEFDLFIKSFLNIYKFNLDSYNSHMNVSNYDRNIITDVTEKLYQEISDYNYYDIKLFIRLTTLIKTKNEPY